MTDEEFQRQARAVLDEEMKAFQERVRHRLIQLIAQRLVSDFVDKFMKDDLGDGTCPRTH